MEQFTRLKYLFDRYADDSITAAEKAELMELVRQPGMEDALKELIGSESDKIDQGLLAVSKEMTASKADEIFKRIMPAIKDVPSIPRKEHRIGPGRWWWAAAAIVAIGIGCYVLFLNKPKQDIAQTQEQRFKNDVAPGGNNAILTLGNGKQIILDSAHNGELAKQGNANIIKTDSGKLAYDITNEKPTELIYNVLTTPRKSQYHLILSDGSEVWLNAESSIRYPTVFTGKERTVEITGEAYFEVKHDAKMPFRVKVGNETIEDLGTSFNVNAYADEDAIRTTLLEGSIKVATGTSSNIVKPGQQVMVNAGQIKVENGADLEQVMAWKNGVFQFEGATVESIMRQLSRWYDVDVEYDSHISKHFRGTINRNVNVSEVFRMLELTGEIHFKIEGKKITVMK